MNYDALISEICKRVQQRVAACENEATGTGCAAAEDKPVLLVLAQDHGTICHPVYTHEDLTECYTMRCALLDENWEVGECEGVIAYTLTNEAAGKIVNGIFDTNYTKAFGKALLSGKKIFIPMEEVELYRYKNTAPAAYYQKLEANIEFLKANGVVIVPNDQLVSAIMGADIASAKASVRAAASEEDGPVVAKMIAFSRRVLSERDVISAKQNGTTHILLTGRTIITDLAKDYAKKYDIVIKQDDGRKK